ncbi:uncharacterized protein ATC70_005643 [Mucor velutinosus]|uniref:Uncharacterized protein n=1 Tax=Mucor velutinosus TaxID=708070 RepID=A0AAN7DAL9_9FUNG|nr:hypothetical protein ATC70_005643 [Mucor velutinosus]
MPISTETATNTNSNAKPNHQQQQSHHNASDTEKKLQSKLESYKHFALKMYHQAQFYWDAIKVNLVHLWQYEEFRLGVYVFGLLSVIPTACFLLFLAVVVLLSTVVASFIWTFFVFSALTLGLMVLVPILMACSVTVGFFIVGYHVYYYLLGLKHANKKADE